MYKEAHTNSFCLTKLSRGINKGYLCKAKILIVPQAFLSRVYGPKRTFLRSELQQDKELGFQDQLLALPSMSAKVFIIGDLK